MSTKRLEASISRDTLLMSATGQVMKHSQHYQIEEVYQAAGVEIPDNTPLGRAQTLRDIIPIAASELTNNLRQACGLHLYDDFQVRPAAQKLLHVDRFGQKTRKKTKSKIDR